MVQEQLTTEIDLGDEQAGRRSGDDRRAASERRRSARGLFEVRARREGVVSDRRRHDRRDPERRTLRSWLTFWRRQR